MMYNSKRMIWYWILLVAGVALFICGCMELIDSSISGIGGGLAGVSAVKLIQGGRYRKNAEYAKNVDTAYSDERNIFISGKAKSWAFYITVMALAAATIVLYFMGKVVYGQITGCILAAMVAVYWIAYMILLRKY